MSQPNNQLPCETQIDYSIIYVNGRILPFRIELDLNLSNLAPGPGEFQRFCYRITGIGQDLPVFADLSHLVFGICQDITAVQIRNVQVFIDGEQQDITGKVELKTPSKPDLPTGCPGLKFDFGLNKIQGDPGSQMLICFELTTPYPVDDIQVCLFGGGKAARGATICGPACTGPPAPELSLTKQCEAPPDTYFNVGEQATITLTVVNSGGAAVAMPTVVDRINVPDNVQISSLTTTPVAATTSPPTGPYSGTNIDITWTGLTETLPAFSWVQLTVTFTILDAPTEGAVITDVDAGIGQLSGTPQYTCTIPVKKTPPPPPPPPSRGLSINDFIITTRRFPE